MKILGSAISLIFMAATCMVSAQETEISKESASIIIKKINESILETKNFSATLQYNIYKLHTDTVAYNTTDGFYKRNATNEHSMLVGIETIQNKTERLMIDSSNRSIALANPNPKVQLIDESMNSALAICKKITRQTNKNGYSTLRLFLDGKSNTGFSRIELCFDDDRYFIKSLTLFYSNTLIPGFEDIKNPKVEIIYSNVSTSRIPHSEFSTDRFIEKKNEKYVLKQYYRNYSFSNQYTSNKNL